LGVDGLGWAGWANCFWRMGVGWLGILKFEGAWVWPGGFLKVLPMYISTVYRPLHVKSIATYCRACILASLIFILTVVLQIPLLIV